METEDKKLFTEGEIKKRTEDNVKVDDLNRFLVDLANITVQVRKNPEESTVELTEKENEIVEIKEWERGER